MMDNAAKAALFDILDDLDCGTIVLDAEHRICHWSRWMQDFADLRAEEVVGHLLWDVLPSLRDTRVQEGVQDALSAGAESFLSHSLHGLTFPLRCHDNRPLLHDVIVRPVSRLAEPHCLIQIKDVTERRHAQDALAQSRKRYQATFENAGVGVGEADLEGRLLRVNDRMCEILGYSHSELLGRGFHNITHPDDRENSVHQVLQLTSGPARRFSLEKRYIHKNGSTVWATLTCSVVRDAHGQPAYFVATIEDISRRRTAEAERGRLMKQKDLLMRETHHRVKNSLALVASMLSLQIRRIHNPEARVHLSDAYQRILAVAHLHERLYQGDHADQVDLDGLLQGLCADLRESVRAVEGGQNVIAETDVRMFISADNALPLAIVVSELVTNAVKYAHPDGSPGTITIRCIRSEANTLDLCIRDDGVGLPPGFDPAASGGLGMSIIRALVDQLKGKLSFRSDGGGTEVSLTVPNLD
jgi:PAS domain S-box-containing protein